MYFWCCFSVTKPHPTLCDPVDCSTAGFPVPILFMGLYRQELEKDMATHSSILAWRIPRTEEPGGATIHGVERVGHVTKPPQSRRLAWVAISSSRGPRFVRTLHYDPSVLGGPAWPWLVALRNYTSSFSGTRLWFMNKGGVCAASHLHAF